MRTRSNLSLSLTAGSLALLATSPTAQVRADFNGDGFSDLAIADPTAPAAGQLHAGAVTVCYGSFDGVYPSFPPAQEWSQQVFSGTPEAGERLGSVLASGDFDADGNADLVIGVPNENWNVSDDGGIAHVIFGTFGAGLTGSPQDVYQGASDEIPGVVTLGNLFGAALAVADFNGDGFDDLAIGAPGEEVDGFDGAGTVTIVHGWSGGLEGSPVPAFVLHQNVPGVPGGCEDGDGFGGALTAGDFNGDGFADLAIGVPQEDIGSTVDAGSIAIVYGSTASLDPQGATPAEGFNQGNLAIPGSTGESDEFGATLAAGDFDADGRDDLAIGAPEDGLPGLADVGTVTVMRGSPSGIDTPGIVRFDQSNFGLTPSTGDDFGLALAVGDATADGFDELIVGAPGDAGDAPGGGVHILVGTGVGLIPLPGIITGPADIPHTGFGAALTLGDYNANGFEDIAIGVPDVPSFGGAVQILGIGLNEALIQSLPGLPTFPFFPFAEFGGALK